METTKPLSEWTGNDIVEWVARMNALGVHAENFRSVKDLDELASFTKVDLEVFGLSKQEALILHKRVEALMNSGQNQIPQKTLVKQLSYGANAR